MKKVSKNDKINLFFSAFLVTAFVVCVHFFTQFTATLDSMVGNIINAFVFVLFGLILFYATRVGDGKAVKRFSVFTLVFMVLPALYIVIASFAAGLPFSDQFVNADGSASLITVLAGVVLGYGIPYTFLSGFELSTGEEETEEAYVLEGGIEADLEDDFDEEEPADTDDEPESKEAEETEAE